LVHLKGLSRLRFLAHSHTSVTDAGLSFPSPEGRGFPVKPPGCPVGFPVLGHA
jgi:hypothetical protein